MTLDQAGAKWERNTANAGAHWAEAVRQGDYCGAMTNFLGQRPNRMCSNWQSGVGAVSAAQFQGDISGKRAKYEAGMRRAASY